MSNILDKSTTLWKNYKGWGDTHSERETFEELYRAFNRISSEQVLTYGQDIPREPSDALYDAVSHLTATNDTAYLQESLYKKIPIVKKHVEVTLEPISPNCNHSFIVKIDGKQAKNIIPFDYSDTGIYNYELKTQEGREIPFGICDWILDTNSSLLVFQNGTPLGVSASKPPVLTFYQYVGPSGERHYIDAILLDTENVEFENGSPVADVTSYARNSTNNIEEDFLHKYGLHGGDGNPGIGLEYNLLTPVTDSNTNDPIMGYDDNSNSQVVNLLSSKKGTGPLEVLFVSQEIENGEHVVVVEKDGISKIDEEHGFFVVKAAPGTYTITVEETEELKTVLLVKDNETQDWELFFPRNPLQLTIKLPVFADLITLPPHLKLSVFNSYSDHITHQYYGPRTVDFVIATDESASWRSADFVIYNKDKFYLKDAFAVKEGKHILARNATYKNHDEELEIKGMTFSGETKENVILKELSIKLEDAVLENAVIEGDIEVSGTSILRNVKCTGTITVKEEGTLLIEDSELNTVENYGELKVFDSGVINIRTYKVQKEDITAYAVTTIFDTTVSNDFYSEGKVYVNGGYVNNFTVESGAFYVQGSRISNLKVLEAEEGSLLDTTSIDYVENLPSIVKIDSSYVTKFSDAVERSVYPDEATMPFYTAFNNRVYAKIPAPFKYEPETNTLELKLDSITHTLFINDNGELQARFFNSDEIAFTSKDNVKTQIEEVYGEHADTVLDKKRPDNVDEALIDLYWSKADLKGGKIPLDQIPDAIASGGLSPVGTWSFEDHGGRYPTFADIDFRFMSDDSYTDLQRGWFFIVAASHKDDDPCYPQRAIDGVEFTAGDWIVYGGRNKELVRDNITVQPLNGMSPVKEDKNTFLQYSKDYGKTAVFSSCKQYSDKNKKFNDLSTVAFFENKVDLYKSEGNFHFVESYPVEYIEGVFTGDREGVVPYRTVTQIKIGDYTFNVLGTAVRSDATSYNNLYTHYLTKEDYLNGKAGTVGRLILEAANDESKDWAESIFETVDGKFALRPTMIDGWYGETHAENDLPLDKWDEIYAIIAYWSGAVPGADHQFDKWEKIDRAYLDPVYSRLPEMAPVKDGVNVHWSVDDGGTGLLRLDYKTLAEAIRLINEQLLNFYPDRPTTIRKIQPTIDVEKTTSPLTEYIEIDLGQLSQYVTDAPKYAYDAGLGVVAISQTGAHDYLPLECCFYSGLESTVDVLDFTKSILADNEFNIEKFDPYEKYKLGFRAPTKILATEINGLLNMGLIEGYAFNHSIRFSQYDLVADATVLKIPELEGESLTLEFEERKFYDMSETIINPCIPTEVNIAALNNLMNSNRTGGIGFIPNGTSVVGQFKINNFTKYKSISKDAKVEMTARFGEVELPVEITSQYLDLVNREEGAFDLTVQFAIPIELDIDAIDELEVKASCSNFGYDVPETTILDIKDLYVCQPNEMMELQVQPGAGVNPTFGTGANDFGAPYVKKDSINACNELAWLDDEGIGYQFPKKDLYLNKLNNDLEANNYQPNDKNGTPIEDEEYRYVMFKYSLGEIKDICGFTIALDWATTLPEVSNLDGTLKGVTLQVMPRSQELQNVNLSNGNSPVPVFFQAEFTPDEPCLYPGHGDAKFRRITFGRKPIPVEDIYIRVGIAKNTGLCLNKIGVFLE